MRRTLTVLCLIGCVALPRGAGAQGGSAGLESTIESQSSVKGSAAERAERYVFRNSTLVWFHSVGALGLVKSSDLTWNPVYSWLFRLNPRFYITDKLSLRLKIGLGVEWTNADDTTTYREPRWEDVWFDVVYGPAYKERFTKIEITPSLRFVVPTSKESRAESLYLGIGPGFALRREFKLPWRMTADLSYSFRYLKNLNHYTTVQYDAPSIISCGAVADVSSGSCGSLIHSGSRVASHQFINILLAELGITRKLKASLMVAFFNNLLYGVTPATVALAGGETMTVGEDPQNNVSHRAAVWYLIEASYQIHPIVAVGAAVSTLSPQLTEDSSLRAPFFNRYTEFVFSTTIALDQAVATVEQLIRSRRARR
jgi:hypothetical protein